MAYVVGDNEGGVLLRSGKAWSLAGCMKRGSRVAALVCVCIKR